MFDKAGIGSRLNRRIVRMIILKELISSIIYPWLRVMSRDHPQNYSFPFTRLRRLLIMHVQLLWDILLLVVAK